MDGSSYLHLYYIKKSPFRQVDPDIFGCLYIFFQKNGIVLSKKDMLIYVIFLFEHIFRMIFPEGDQFRLLH